MSLTWEQKKKVMEKFKIHPTDTGSVEVQVALLTQRITHLTEHLKQHPKDFHSRRGLLKMVGRRKRLLTYLSERDIKRYRKLIRALKIRG